MQAGPRRNVRAEAARNEPRTRTLERVKKRVNLYLASRSPRRRELLAGLGFRFEALDVEVDEARTPGETPARYVERVARKKVFAGLEAVEGMPGSGAGGCGAPVVVGADTIVAVDGEVFGKPRDDAEILAQLERLSGRSHLVLSAVAVVSGDGSGAARPAGTAETRLSRSRVWFRPLSEAERRRYRETGEPADKAGSYAVQGLAAAFVTRLEGSWSGIVGLPLHETVELLGRAGVPFLPPAPPSGTSRR